MTIVGSNGTRVEKAADFFTGPIQTSLAPDEILTEVHLPVWPAVRRWAFREFARRKGDFAMAGVALFYDLDKKSRAIDAHIGAIGVSDCPIRLTTAETALNGNPVTEETIAAVVKAAKDSIDPPSDIHAPAAYRRSLLGTLLARGLQQSAS
jgi:carbon-monoxide dehydrogenase medium subunit